MRREAQEEMACPIDAELEDYGDFLANIKGCIQKAQLQAALSVSREVVWLCWFSSRNLNYMRTFAEAYPDAEIVQQLLDNSPLPWGHHIRLMDR